MKKKLIETIDYYLDKNKNIVFTREYHLKRGYCCQSGCVHCPYQILDPNTPQEFNSSWSEDEIEYKTEDDETFED
jgi:hypothetical protein